MNIFRGNKDSLQTMIIPVENDNRSHQYTIKVSETLWNEFQMSVLIGLSERNIVGRFDVKEANENR